jgi:hypothetical protein
MSITFNDVIKPITSIFRMVDADGNHTYVGGYSTSFDIFPLDVAENDYLMFTANNWDGRKFNKIVFTVDSLIEADVIEGVWEYYTMINSSTYSNTSDNWKPLNIIEDTGNNFTTDDGNGNISVTWEMPEDWDNYCKPGGDSVYYNFVVRFRITNISNIQTTGNITSTKCYSYSIYVNNEDITFEDLYQTSESNGWNVISKHGLSDYIFNSALFLDPSSILSSSNETITFLNNYSLNNMGIARFGKVTATGDPYKGTTLRFEGANTDFSSLFLGRDYSEFYNLVIQYPQDPSRSYLQHGYWGGGVGSTNNQEILGGIYYNFRHYSFTNVNNIIRGLTLYGAQIETIGAIIDNVKFVDTLYGIRGEQTINNISVHRLDFTRVYRAAFNGYRIRDVETWKVRFIDCDYDDSKDLATYYQAASDDNSHALNYKLIDTKSFLTKAINKDLNSVPDVNMCITDKENNIVYVGSSNIDGYFSNNHGSISGGDNLIIDYDNFVDGSDNSMRYQEVYVTSGNCQGSKRIIHHSDTSQITLDSKLPSIPDVGSNFIHVPYIDYRWQSPDKDEVTTNGYGAAPIVYPGPFNVAYRKYGYKFVNQPVVFNKPVESSVSLSENIFIIPNIEDVQGISGIVIDSYYKTIKVESAVTVKDLYSYLQYWCTLEANINIAEVLSTADGINYTLLDDWKILLEISLSDQFNIKGDIYIDDVVYLSNLNVDGDINFNVSGDVEIVLNNVHVLGSIINNNPDGKLDIKLINGSTATTTNPGTDAGQTNIFGIDVSKGKLIFSSTLVGTDAKYRMMFKDSFESGNPITVTDVTSIDIAGNIDSDTIDFTFDYSNDTLGGDVGTDKDIVIVALNKSKSKYAKTYGTITNSEDIIINIEALEDTIYD